MLWGILVVKNIFIICLLLRFGQKGTSRRASPPQGHAHQVPTKYLNNTVHTFITTVMWTEFVCLRTYCIPTITITITKWKWRKKMVWSFLRLKCKGESKYFFTKNYGGVEPINWIYINRKRQWNANIRTIRRLNMNIFPLGKSPWQQYLKALIGSIAFVHHDIHVTYLNTILERYPYNCPLNTLFNGKDKTLIFHHIHSWTILK